MTRRIAILAVAFLLLCLAALPAAAQGNATQSGEKDTSFFGLAVIGMAIAAFGCGLGQSNALRGACDGIARNPGAGGPIRLFLFMGLALIEFLALLTFVVAVLVIYF